jgi:quercetin dioxygenase-like cupin family protein
MRRSGIALAGVVTAAAAAASVTPSASATPPSGAVGSTVARGGFVDQVDVKVTIPNGHGRQVVQVKDAADTIVQRITLAQGGDTGWHSHPGPVFVIVTAGQLTLFDAHGSSCPSRTYTAGQAFVDPGGDNVHLAQNTGPGTAELWATYLDVPPGSAPRIDAANPGLCPAAPTS